MAEEPPAYEYEEVPLDAYGDFGAYDWDDDVPYDEPVAAPAPKPQPAPAKKAVEPAPWEDDDEDAFALPEDDGPIMELSEFQEMLASSFGAGVKVEEA